MLTVIVTLDVMPGRIDEFIDIVDENARLSLLNEEGCLVFDVATSVEVPGRFFLYEKYTDDDAFFVKHREAEHYATFIARSTPLIVPGSKTVACAQPVAPRTETVPQ